MKVVIFGGRDYLDWEFALVALDTLHAIHGFTLVIQGEADGADLLGKRWALFRDVPEIGFPAQWSIGKRAGFVRNEEMAQFGPDMGVAFPGGNGTLDMLSRLKFRQIPVVDLYQGVRKKIVRRRRR